MADQAQLSPRSWHAHSLASCFPALSDLPVRNAIFANERLSDKLVQLAVQRRFGTDLSSVTSFEDDDAVVEKILQHWSADLLMDIGIAWFAPALVHILVDPSKRAQFEDLPKDTMRQALLARDHAPLTVTGQPDSPVCCHNAGERCLLAWIDTYPDHIKFPVMLRLPESVPEPKDTRTARIALMRRLLDSNVLFTTSGEAR